MEALTKTAAKNSLEIDRLRDQVGELQSQVQQKEEEGLEWQVQAEAAQR